LSIKEDLYVVKSVIYRGGQLQDFGFVDIIAFLHGIIWLVDSNMLVIDREGVWAALNSSPSLREVRNRWLTGLGVHQRRRGQEALWDWLIVFESFKISFSCLMKSCI